MKDAAEGGIKGRPPKGALSGFLLLINLVIPSHTFMIIAQKLIQLFGFVTVFLETLVTLAFQRG